VTQSQAQAPSQAEPKSRPTSVNGPGATPAISRLKWTGTATLQVYNRPDIGPTQPCPDEPSSLQCQHSDPESRFAQISPDISKPLKAVKHQNPVHVLSKLKLFLGSSLRQHTCKPFHEEAFH
jgi:hypothetical protein